MLSTLKSSYEALPSFLKNFASLLPQPFTLSSSYRQERAVIQQSKGTPDAARAIQKMRLAQILVHAAETVPAYVGLCGGKLSREAIFGDPFSALTYFPVVSKEEVAGEPERYLSNLITPRSRYLATTGGTTGAPLKIWLSNAVWATEWAYVFDYLSRFGITPRDRRVSLRGVQRIDSESTIFEENPIYRELRISPFHLSSRHIDHIAKRIRDARPSYIHGYPSAVRDLLTLLGGGAKEVLSSVRVLLLVSENLPASERDYIEQISGCRVASFYGHSERACFAPYDHSKCLWVPESSYGVTEIIDSKIVATGFLNLAMPLVRYDTGDVVACDAHNTPLDVGCGFSSIEGRWGRDHLIGKSGQKITMTALNTHIPEMQWVRKFQFQQSEPGRAAIRMMLTPHDRPTEIATIISKEFTRKCGGEIDFSIEMVDDIPLSKAGKHSFITRS